MSSSRVVAFVLLVVGSILLFLASPSSRSAGAQLTEAVTGRFPDANIWLLIPGAAAAAAGVGLLLFGGSASN